MTSKNGNLFLLLLRTFYKSSVEKEASLNGKRGGMD